MPADVFTTSVKTVYRRLIPTALRARATHAREWALVFLNYALMRSRIANWFHRFGVWPHALYIESTNICNARCVFCAYPQMRRPKVTMPLATFKKAVEQYLELGPGEIDLTPIVGDPFVDKHLFERLDWLGAHPKVTRFHFYTNAILMDAERVERLLRYDERFMIFCSFGGFDRKTYAAVMGVDKFEEAVGNIKALLEAKRRSGSHIGVCVNLRIPPGSAHGEFWDALCRARDENVITFDETDDFDNWGGAITDEALRGAGLVPKPPPVHRGPCRRLVTGPIVLADGRVNACTCRDVEATLIIGDVNQKPLRDILAGPQLQGLLDRHELEDFPAACKRCSRYESLYPLWMQGRLWRLCQKIFGRV